MQHNWKRSSVPGALVLQGNKKIDSFCPGILHLVIQSKAFAFSDSVCLACWVFFFFYKKLNKWIQSTRIKGGEDAEKSLFSRISATKDPPLFFSPLLPAIGKQMELKRNWDWSVLRKRMGSIAFHRSPLRLAAPPARCFKKLQPNRNARVTEQLTNHQAAFKRANQATHTRYNGGVWSFLLAELIIHNTPCVMFTCNSFHKQHHQGVKDWLVPRY